MDETAVDGKRRKAGPRLVADKVHFRWPPGHMVTTRFPGLIATDLFPLSQQMGARTSPDALGAQGPRCVWGPAWRLREALYSMAVFNAYETVGCLHGARLRQHRDRGSDKRSPPATGPRPDHMGARLARSGLGSSGLRLDATAARGAPN